jgi:FAD/FMN-containing dehydrogenase
VALLALARARLGAGLTGFEVMGRFALDLVARHFPQLPRRCPAPPGPCCWSKATTKARPRRARASRRCWATRWSAAVSDAVVAESLAQSRALWHVRESIPLAQAEEGLNIKHDISVPVSAIPPSSPQTDAALQAASPACGWSTSATWATATCTTTCRPRPGGDASASWPSRSTRSHGIVYDAVARFGGSISAEHGVGALKRDELVERKSPVALRADAAHQAALDPQGRLNPNRVPRAPG